MRQWNFDNSYARLPGRFFTLQNPVPVRAPKMVIFNRALADFLGTPDELAVFAGNHVPAGAAPLAQAYAGHQFGHFTMLGDGRAVLLGEQITPGGQRFDIQLKGSGQTPYSRRGDGRAALGPMLREYVMSEAMHGLGIPTTRSLAVVETGEPVQRETLLAGAVLTRVAASHIRVGTFEYAAHFGDLGDVQILADYTIARHFPGASSYVEFLRQVVARQASLIARWQLSGFIHGVMNTDNMAISGETIDYGPCAFMDVYDPNTVFSSIDTEGRYAYKNQPKMAVWNLSRFAETLLPLLHANEKEAVKIATAEVKAFWDMYHQHWLAGMRAKLGLFDEDPADEPLIAQLLQLMQRHKADYTNTFRALTLGEPVAEIPMEHFAPWYDSWQARLNRPGTPRDEVTAHMMAHNPAVIPRNYRVDAALDAAGNGDLSVMHDLLRVLQNPYGYTREQNAYAQPPAPEFYGYQTFCGT
ncbi:MAG: YdiU family protein [Defluviitaleaceae bacterium]|nr:YdiU family protein [Defluviitaleaceae bacterium]